MFSPSGVSFLSSSRSMGETLLSPVSSPIHSSNSVSGIPIIVVAVVGIFATAFLLVGYYIFVIKCCLNWQRVDILRRFSLSSSTHHQQPLVYHSPETRGLDSSAIRSIPLIQYKKPTDGDGRTVNFECAVCLSEFEDNELLKKLPKCGHLFHIDCVDIWLQNSSNCPICRTSISNHHHPVTPNPSPRNPITFSGNLVTADDDFVVIELGHDHEHPPERSSSDEIPTTSVSPRKIGQRIHTPKYGRNLKKITSLDDECVDMREKDEQFSVQPIRRSFSMDLSADRQLYLAVQEALQLNRRDCNAVGIGPIEGCSSRVRRTLFSIGHGRRSRTAVLPI